MVFKVLVVDDLIFYCCWVKEIFDDDREFEVVGEVRNGCDVLEKVEVFKFDVIIMDVEMFVMDGILVVKVIMEKWFMLIFMFFLFIYYGV